MRTLHTPSRIGRSATHIVMIERRQRRIEVRELCIICRAVGPDPVALFAEFAEAVASSS